MKTNAGKLATLALLGSVALALSATSATAGIAWNGVRCAPSGIAWNGVHPAASAPAWDSPRYRTSGIAWNGFRNKDLEEHRGARDHAIGVFLRMLQLLASSR